jgi:hypothetical protein
MSTDLVQADIMLKTTPVEEASEFSPAQFVALGALLSGKTATDAAAAAGIGRRTLYDWMQKNFQFQAALNRGRRELQQAISVRISQLTASAAECVADAVAKGNVKAALEVLKRTNALAPAKIGSEDEIRLEIEHEERLHKRDTDVLVNGLNPQMLLRDK